MAKIKMMGRVSTETKFEDNGSDGSLTSRSHRIKTVDDLIAHCKVDLNYWKPDRVVINKWEVGAKVEDVVITEELFQVKVWLKRHDEAISATGVADLFKKLVKGHVPKKLIRPPVRRTQKKYMLELGCAGDLHLGKLAHAPETRGRDYDCKIATSLYRDAVDTILGKAPQSEIEKILVVLGSDQFHTDSMANQTTAGTPQDYDGRFPKVYKLGCEMSVEAIDKALSIAPVQLVVVQGNHDNLTSWHLGEFLRAWYRNHKHVTIDNRPTSRHYVQYHANLLGLVHGNSRKEIKSLSRIMAHECRDIWSSVRHTEWHVGHVHHQSTTEDIGCVTRTLSALCSADKWHSDSGYVGSKQAAQGFLWHKERGMEDILGFNVQG